MVCKVHPGCVVGQNIPGITCTSDLTKRFWEGRYTSIRNWEQHLAKNGTVILKFFLNVGKNKQKHDFSRVQLKKKLGI